MDTNVQNKPPSSRPSAANRRQVFGLALTIVNILFSLLPLLILIKVLAEFMGLVPYQGRPVEDSQQIVIIAMLSYGVLVFIYSVYCLIRFFRHREIKLTLPLVFFVVYASFTILVIALFAFFQGMLNGSIIL